MTLMILPLCKIQWWWAHSSTSIMRGVCWGNVLHARQWAGVDGTCCTIHVTICSLSESLAPQACGLWNQAVGSVAGLILPAVLGATAQTCDLNQPALQPSLFFWFQLYHHVKYKQPDKSTCAIGICWNGERMWGSKHKQQATSTAITGINKESTRATAERGHHIRSKSQHMKYKCCQNRQDFFSKDTFPKTKCALCFQSFRSVLNPVSKALLLAAWRRKLLTHYPICPWGD